MTLSLVHNSTLSRVEISCTGLEDGTVTVQRSLDEVTWTTVRGGVAVTTVAGVATLHDYEFAADVENFYRVVPNDPAGGLLMTAGGWASTPDNAALDILADMDLRADVTADNWASGVIQSLMAKWNSGAGQQSYWLSLAPTGEVRMSWSPDGTTTVTATSTAVPVPVNGRLTLRAELDVDVNATDWRVLFYTAPTADGPFVQLGSAVSGSPQSSVFNSTAVLEAGSRNNGGVQVFSGIIHSLRVRNDDVAGVLVANPNFDDQPDGTTSFTDGAGRVWTVNGTARIYGTQTNSITPVLDGVWFKSLSNPALNRPVTVRDWSDILRPSRTGIFPVVGAKFPIAVTEVRGSRQWMLDLKAADPDEAALIDAILDDGGVLLVHVPANSTVPGGYVVVGDSVEQHFPFDVPTIRFVSLPMTEVAAPPPEVTGVSVP